MVFSDVSKEQVFFLMCHFGGSVYKMAVSTITNRLLGRAYLNNPEEVFSTTTNRLLARVYLNNPQEVFSTATNRLVSRVHLNHNLDEIPARITSRIQVKVYLNNFLEQIGVITNRLTVISYASTILSEEDQADGYWEDWIPPTPPITQRKRKRFFISAFSYVRDKNR